MDVEELLSNLDNLIQEWRESADGWDKSYDINPYGEGMAMGLQEASDDLRFEVNKFKNAG